jgi:uncharacterized protein (DUF1501 family)
MNRRLLLKHGALVAAGSFMPAWTRRALAQETGGNKVLVFLFLRGALDGLHAVPPADESRLYALRPQLARREDMLDLGVPGFALHRSMEALLPFWRDGSLAIVHAVGSPDPTRSHFEAQDFLELGTPGVKGTPEGWLARSLTETPRNPSLVEAVAISPRLPRSLQGAPGALAFSSLDQLRLHALAGAPAGKKGRAEAQAAFDAMYGLHPEEPVAASGKEAFAAVQLLERKLGATPGPEPEYPKSPLSQPLRQLAKLIKADVGLRIGCLDAGGWDTHAAQPGRLENGLCALAESLAAFQRDLGRRAADVMLIAATEFGRTVRQNGANGTDHGHGSVAFVLGGGVRGGRIHGRWPGLQDDRLYEGRDLEVTTDLRSLLAAAAKAQLGVRDLRRLFPGFDGAPLAGLV